MKRRTAIKIVALSSLAPGLKALDADAAWSASDYTLRFFTPEENHLLDELMEMIIPADGHSPGAHAAQVSLFADMMVATSNEKTKAQWRRGLSLMRQEAGRSSLADALAKSSAHEAQPQTELERFFVVLKRMSVDGYYTSAIGIHQDLQYQGNTYLAAFPGCTNPALKQD
ncbi:MAG: gluconate 2-dehydrogenase subunit 3 family protein [Terriglobia bacterium]